MLKEAAVRSRGDDGISGELPDAGDDLDEWYGEGEHDSSRGDRS